MNAKTTGARMRSTLGRHRKPAAGSAIVLLGVLTWLLLRDDPRPPDTGDTPRTATGEMGGMEMDGMDMSGDGTVQLTSDQLREFGIIFSTAEIRPLTAQVRTVGLVTFDERRVAQVAPKFAGFVERMYVNFTGQPVGRGQPLLEIYSPELVAAQ